MQKPFAATLLLCPTGGRKWAVMLSCLIMCTLPAAAHKLVPLQSAKVISQNIGASNGGAVAMPIGTMLVAVPITRQSNIVVVETSHNRLTWSEVGKHMLVLPVNETIQFYQDGNWFVVLDSKHKKHKFALIHEESLPE